MIALLEELPSHKQAQRDKEDLRQFIRDLLHDTRNIARQSACAPAYALADIGILEQLARLSDQQLDTVSRAISVDVCVLRSGEDLKFWTQLDSIAPDDVAALCEHAANHLVARGVSSNDLSRDRASFGNASPFSESNIKLLLRARRAARQDIDYATLKFDMADEVAGLIAQWSDHRLLSIATSYPLPLFVLRGARNVSLWRKILRLESKNTRAARILGHHLTMLGPSAQILQ